MTRRARVWSLVGAALFTILVGAVAWSIGHLHGRMTERAMNQEMSRVEEDVLKWVVEIQPEARIRDWTGFIPFLIKHSEAVGIDWRLVLAMAWKESQLDPSAIGARGEIGFLQILPATGARIAESLGEQEVFTPPTLDRKTGRYRDLGSLGDIRTNTRYGLKYLADQMVRFHGVNATALRAYNRNPDRALERRPQDRYAEDVALQLVQLIHRFK